MVERWRRFGFCAIRMAIEVLEVATVVKDEELLFVLSLTEDIGAEACATANHLVELDLGVHLLEEHQVEAVRHIDARIHHIDGDDYLYVLLCFVARGREDVDEVLPVVDLVIDEHAVVVAQLWIKCMEAVHDELCVLVVASKDDGFAEGVAILYL